MQIKFRRVEERLRNDRPAPEIFPGRRSQERLRGLWLIGLLLLPLLTACLTPVSSNQAAFYESEIAPILRRNCVRCHGVEEREAGLDLRTLRGILRGGESGPAVVWGDPDKSWLLDMVVRGDMPPKGPPLNAAEIELLRRWIGP